MRNHFKILPLLLTITSCAFSQADFYAMSTEGVRAKIDSLRKILPALKDAERIDCLSELSNSYLAFSIDTAKIYADKVLTESERINYVTGKAKAYKNLGRVAFNSSTDLPAAERYFEMSLDLFLTNGNEHQVSWGWAALACSKWVLGKFTEAMNAFKKAEQLFKKIGDTDNLAGAYGFMFATEFQRGNYAESLEYIFKREDLTGEEDYSNLAELYDELGDTATAEQYRNKISLDNFGDYKYMFMAESFYRKHQYDSAFHYYNLYSVHVNPEDESSCAGLYFGIGKTHFSLKHYDTALAYLNRSLKMSEGSGDQTHVLRVLLLLTRTNQEKGNYIAAIKYGQHLLRIANETGARQFTRDAHLLLYQLFEKVQNKDSAYLHLRKYTAINDSIDLDLSAQKLAFYKIKSEREQGESRINDINKEKQIQQERLKQTAQQKNFLIVGSIALLLIAVVVFRNISLKRKNEKLRMENELKLQQLESEKTRVELQQQASELEMQALRAQMNPHFIFNCLNSINMFILENNKLHASEYLSKFSRLVRLILQNSQEAFIVLDKELEALRLYLELEALRFEQKFEYKISVSDEVDTTMIKVPPLIIQPYAENAIWHGLMHLPPDELGRLAGKPEKGHLEIELTVKDDMLFCKISDDGIGRKRAEELKSKSSLTYKSMGMRITANRIAILQQQECNNTFITVNDLVFPDNRPAGTEVVIKIPLRYD